MNTLKIGSEQEQVIPSELTDVIDPWQILHCLEEIIIKTSPGYANPAMSKGYVYLINCKKDY